MTIELKAALVAFINAMILCLQTFGVPMSNAQQAAIGGVVNTGLAVWMLVKHRRVKKSGG